MYLAGSWPQADVSLMVVMGLAVTAVVAIGIYVVRAALARSADAEPRREPEEERTDQRTDDSI